MGCVRNRRMPRNLPHDTRVVAPRRRQCRRSQFINSCTTTRSPGPSWDRRIDANRSLDTPDTKPSGFVISRHRRHSSAPDPQGHRRHFGNNHPGSTGGRVGETSRPEREKPGIAGLDYKIPLWRGLGSAPSDPESVSLLPLPRQCLLPNHTIVVIVVIVVVGVSEPAVSDRARDSCSRLQRSAGTRRRLSSSLISLERKGSYLHLSSHASLLPPLAKDCLSCQCKLKCVPPRKGGVLVDWRMARTSCSRLPHSGSHPHGAAATVSAANAGCPKRGPSTTQ